MAEITTNPPATASNALSSFLGFLGGVAGTLASGKLAEEQARSAAKVQAILNANHAVNPATGPNDPAAAQAAANRSFLEKYLPAEMLFSTDAAGVRTPKLTYYVVLGSVLLVFLLVLRRIMRK